MTQPAIAAVCRVVRPARQRRRTIRCDSCGELREISYEHYHRIEQGIAQAPQCICESLPQPKVEEQHLRFWLRRYGAPAAEVQALTASGYIAAHGMPGELADLALGVFPRGV